MLLRERRQIDQLDAMSSKGIMPGMGSRVVNGKSPTAGVARVSARTSDDLPVFGGPARATWPAPSRGMM